MIYTKTTPEARAPERIADALERIAAAAEGPTYAPMHTFPLGWGPAPYAHELPRPVYGGLNGVATHGQHTQAPVHGHYHELSRG